ncbi:MAG: sigma-70 family RNA polymerase sigma factor [bacterium]
MRPKSNGETDEARPGVGAGQDNPAGPAASKPSENQLNGVISSDQAPATAAPSDDFERIYLEHRARVFSTAYRFVRNREDAEDVTQDVFIKVYRKMAEFRGDAALSTWVYRITVNTALDLLRRRKRRQAVSLDEVSEPSAGPSNLKNLIESMIPTLPEGYRKVFVLHDIEGLKHNEIAEILGITEGASKSQLHRARASLRKALSPYLRKRLG